MRTRHLKELAYVAPIALVVGALMAAIQPGSFWLGWVGFAVLLALGLFGLAASLRSAAGGRTLVLMTGLALGLRLLVGTTLHLVLPVDGYDEPDDRSGHVFTDAHRRDDQAWELASSEAPLLSAFDRGYYSDQYGGLLALSSLTYRVLSPDAHRPLLTLTLAALTAALGVPFFFSATRQLWDVKLATAATWLYCLYPESVLTGGAQMREPFLVTFISAALWGFAQWLDSRPRMSWLWLGIGFGGLVLISPGIALALLVLLGVWLRIRGEHARAGLPIWLAGAGLFIAALLFLAWSLGARGEGGGTPVGVVTTWFRDSANWVIYQLERGSGQVQNVFSKLFPAAQLVFVIAYGITQPLLPPAFLEPTTLTWHVIGVARSVGWYLCLPLLAYAPLAIRRLPVDTNRRVWSWLTAFAWFWILLCAVRAGGDQWDNPRYRLIFFGIQALVATFAWLWWRSARDPWLPRIVAAEAACLLWFSQWYLARYYLIGIHFPIMVVMGLCIVSVFAILLGGALWDRLRQRRQRT